MATENQAHLNRVHVVGDDHQLGLLALHQTGDRVYA